MRRFMAGIVAVVLSGPAAQAEPRATGAVLLSPAEYKALKAVPTYRAFLPPEADLSRWFPEPGHQAEQPSCTAWATGYALRSYYENRLANSPRAASTPLSPAFIYNRLAQPVGACSKGLPIPAALDLLRRDGVPPLAEFAYSSQSCERQPSAEVMDSASRFRISDWERLDVARLDDLKGQIASGNPVVVVMRLPDSFDDFSGNGVFDEPGGTRLAHAMVAVGYDDRRRAVRLINSWGTRWGDRGFAWVSYRVMAANLVEAYTVNLESPVPPPVTQPPPKPAPAPVIAPPPPPKPPQVAPPPAPKPEPARRSVVEAEKAVHAVVGRLRCASVETVVEVGTLVVRGFVPTVVDRDSLAAAMGDGGAGWRPRLDVAVEPWPHCEARLTLADPLERAGGLSVAIKGGEVLKEGQSLVLDVVTPDYPSHLTVSYIQADGRVVHLRRYGDAAWKPLPPKARLTLGGAGEWRVSGPAFGRESVVVVASAVPLLALDRPASETEREYLTELRLGVLAQQASKAVSAVMAPLTTTP